MNNKEVVFLEGSRLYLRPLEEGDFSTAYLRWLNDPVVNQFSQRRPFPVHVESMKAYVDAFTKNPKEGFVLAVVDRSTNTHIGNIALVNLQPIHRCAEIAILIGCKEHWGKGYAAESIYLLVKHAFGAMNLHKVFAGSFNPAFARCVEKLGWKKEGEFRERIWSEGKYHNQTWHSMLAHEFTEIPEYHIENTALV